MVIVVRPCCTVYSEDCHCDEEAHVAEEEYSCEDKNGGGDPFTAFTVFTWE